jgi:hypothetical protein
LEGARGERAQLLPKSDGETIMISSFQSRSFGVGRNLSEEEIVKINTFREIYRKEYISKEAATTINGNNSKNDIKNNPFTRIFEVGIDKEGYWTFNHMSLQHDDVVDCLQVLFPNHDFVFYYDQSSGHCKKKSDGLNVHEMNKKWGGLQRHMRSTCITDGCLGKFNPVLAVGDSQTMVFTENEVGPFNMTQAARDARRYDKIVGTKRVKKTKSDLLQTLIDEKGFKPTTHYTMEKIIQITKDFGLPLQHEVNKIEEGWVGKPKGLYQVLYERGFIDTSLHKNEYHTTGNKPHWKDETGAI